MQQTVTSQSRVYLCNFAQRTHLTSPHLTSPHLTSPHLTSLHWQAEQREEREERDTETDKNAMPEVEVFPCW